jgi:hypothetical protein
MGYPAEIIPETSTKQFAERASRGATRTRPPTWGGRPLNRSLEVASGLLSYLGAGRCGELRGEVGSAHQRAASGDHLPAAASRGWHVVLGSSRSATIQARIFRE